MHPDWEYLRSEPGPDMRLFGVRFDYYINRRNNLPLKAIVIDSADSVNVVAVTPDQKILLVRQFRFGIQADTIEIPGGLVDPGEDLEQAARRELREETGYTGGRWTYLGGIPSNPVFINATIHHFLAEGVECTHPTAPDDGENFHLLTLTLDELQESLRSGPPIHPHALSGLVRVFDLSALRTADGRRETADGRR